MFLRLASVLMVLDASVSSVSSTDSVYLIRVVTNDAVGVGGAMQHPAPNPVDNYISRYVCRLDECRFAVMLAGQPLTVKVNMKKRDTAYVGWKCRWEHGRGDRVADGHILTSSMYMPFCPCIREAGLPNKVECADQLVA